METKAKNILLHKVEEAIEKMRPFLIADDGNVHVIDISDKMVVTVEFLGACKTCDMNSSTLQSGIAETIMHTVPEIKNVIAAKKIS